MAILGLQRDQKGTLLKTFAIVPNALQYYAHNDTMWQPSIAKFEAELLNDKDAKVNKLLKQCKQLAVYQFQDPSCWFAASISCLLLGTLSSCLLKQKLSEYIYTLKGEQLKQWWNDANACTLPSSQTCPKDNELHQYQTMSTVYRLMFCSDSHQYMSLKVLKTMNFKTNPLGFIPGGFADTTYLQLLKKMNISVYNKKHSKVGNPFNITSINQNDIPDIIAFTPSIIDLTAFCPKDDIPHRISVSVNETQYTYILDHCVAFFYNPLNLTLRHFMAGFIPETTCHGTPLLYDSIWGQDLYPLDWTKVNVKNNTNQATHLSDFYHGWTMEFAVIAYVRSDFSNMCPTPPLAHEMQESQWLNTVGFRA